MEEAVVLGVGAGVVAEQALTLKPSIVARATAASLRRFMVLR